MESFWIIRSLPSPLSALLLIASASLPLVAADPALTTDSSCGCYLTNGSSSTYYQLHQFWDFRSLSQYAGVPSPVTVPSSSATAYATSDYFISDSWNAAWTIQSWNNSAAVAAQHGANITLMINSPTNVYIEKNTDPGPASDTFLTLRTIRQADFQSAAEIESASVGYQHVSVRMLSRTLGSPGGCTAMFTYRGGDSLSAVQEADFEVRTKDPAGAVQYTNQPSYTNEGLLVAAATENVTMPNNLTWSDWAVHRVDWTPSRTYWFVNGLEVANISFQTPRDPSQIIFNSWSDGGPWTGEMDKGKAAYLHVQWIEFVYNTTDPNSGKSSSGQCSSVCSIDDTTKLGTPVRLWGAAPSMRQLGTAARWTPWVAAAVMLFSSLSIL